MTAKEVSGVVLDGDAVDCERSSGPVDLLNESVEDVERRLST